MCEPIVVEHDVVEHGNRPRREEDGRSSGRQHSRCTGLRPAGGETGGELTVGDGDTNIRAGTECVDDHIVERGSQFLVAAEVARRPAGREAAPARALENDARCDGFHRARHQLERARLEREVGVDDRRDRAVGFGFPPAHAARHTVLARASADAARTTSRLPTRSRTTTGTASSAGSRRRTATTGQSGHQTQHVRVDCSSRMITNRG